MEKDKPALFNIFNPPAPPPPVKRQNDAFEASDGWESFGDYFGAKKRKLLEQFHAEAHHVQGSSAIFKGVAISINGNTHPSAEELKRLMMLHGGTFHLYHSNTYTTHIVASNLPFTKIKQLRDKKIVKPEWIVASIREGRLLDWEEFELYPKTERGQSVASTSKADERSSTEAVSVVSKAARKFPLPVAKSPWKPAVAQKAGDPNYLQQFYSRSRLHHLSTWKTDSKQLVRRLQSTADPSFPGRRRLRALYPFRSGPAPPPTVMHIDFDCFFVSAGLLSRPHLIGQPVAVCHGKGQGRASEEADGFGSRSEVSSCNYEARKAGLRNGMYLGEARRLCPGLVMIPYEFERYKEISTTFYEIMASYTLEIEAISCDEMIVDCTEILRETKATAGEFAAFVRSEIFERTGCHASAGLGANQLIARLATKKAKPNGHRYVADADILAFMADIPVDDLPGVGYSASEKFRALHVTTCADLRKASLHTLKREFGPKNGQKFYDFARGIDEREVQNKLLRKSVSADINYGIRMQTVSELETFLLELGEEVQRRLQQASVIGQTITLKLLVRHPDAPFEPPKYMGCGHCNAVNRSVSLIQATDSADVIGREAVGLFKKSGVDVRELRGIGIMVTRLVERKTRPDSGFVERRDRTEDENLDRLPPSPLMFSDDSDEGFTEARRTEPEDNPHGTSSHEATAHPPVPRLDLVAEVGWDRVWSVLAERLRDFFIRPDSSTSTPCEPTIPLATQPVCEKLGCDERTVNEALVTINCENEVTCEEMFPSDASDTDFTLPWDDDFPLTQPDNVVKRRKCDESGYQEFGPLDDAATEVFHEMVMDTECRFWFDYFDIPESYGMTKLPANMYGATLHYLDSPMVLRYREVGKKKITPRIVWATWHLNGVYRKKLLKKWFYHLRKTPGPKQTTLNLQRVTATQAEAQKLAVLSVKGAWRPVMKKSGKVQMCLRMKTPPRMPVVTMTRTISVALPSPSQIDASVLDSLPADILDEIYIVYQKKNGILVRRSEAVVPFQPDARPSVALVKPKKPIHIPVKRSRTTKPRKKPVKISSSQRSLDSYITTRKTNLSQTTSTPKDDKPIADELIDLDAIQRPPSHPSMTLFGKNKVEDVVKVLGEVMRTSDAEADLNTVLLSYTEELVEGKGFCVTNGFMECCYEEIERLSGTRKDGWIAVYEELRVGVQSMSREEFFGSTLFIKSFVEPDSDDD